MKKPLLLVILDGWGYSEEQIGNPIASAKLPTYNFLLEQYPATLLQASGQAVGLSWGEPGNSEVGHMTIGAGRIIPQYSIRIDEAIKSGSLMNNSIFNEINNHIDKYKSGIHLVGLLTSGRVHSSFDHLTSLIDIFSSNDIKNIFLHLFSDGKDSGLKEASKLLERLNNYIQQNNSAVVVSLIGRNFAMDRNHNWDYTKKVFELIAQKKGTETSNFVQTLKDNYEKGINDANIPPLVNRDSSGALKENDVVLFFNFREDSMRQIIQPFIKKDFQFFSRILPSNLLIITMTQYIDDKKIRVLFSPPDIRLGLSETLNNEGKNQLHIAESEKYAHVTQFFNGFSRSPLKRETDFSVESFKYSKGNPKMKSIEITNKVIEEINRDFYDFILINYANADTLAHTGDLNASIAGIEAIDRALSTLYTETEKRDGTIIITSDHGNVESLTYRATGEKEARHNLNPVPFILVNKRFGGLGKGLNKISGILADVAPTILELMEIKKPTEMTGQSLLSVIL